MDNIHFVKRGAGKPVILLHGFPMNHTVWDSFASQLSSAFTVYTPDLPGFGQSAALPDPFSLADVASALIKWMDDEGIQDAGLIGHSLGGYVALAMVSQASAKFASLTLFHSTAYADTPEKKESRTKVLKFIDENGVLAFTSNFINPLFADPAHPAIAEVRKITIQSSARAVKGYTIAMRERPDQTEVLAQFPHPILFIAGQQDPGISVSSVHEQARLSPHSRVEVFDNTGHMGMFEQPLETLTAVKRFLH